jgi:chromosomal replication initiation ATPase DnaA
MYVCKRVTKCSHPELARAFHRKHHGSSVTAVQKIASLVESDLAVRADVDEIERTLGV